MLICVHAYANYRCSRTYVLSHKQLHFILEAQSDKSYAAKDKDTAYFCRQFKQFSFTTRVTGLASTYLPILNRQNEGKTFQDKNMNIF